MFHAFPYCTSLKKTSAFFDFHVKPFWPISSGLNVSKGVLIPVLSDINGNAIKGKLVCAVSVLIKAKHAETLIYVF